jgi:carbonic anhydrase/acetyltransferase-like protein (isoleucine patch superfamily)
MPITTSHINDRSKPLIFLGTNSCLGKYIDVCKEHNIKIHGIIDTDYYGNTPFIDDLPVIDSEDGLVEKIEFYKQFNFFCATNWLPEKTSSRNTTKRYRQIDLLDQLGVNVISLADSKAKISTTCIIGRGSFIDCFALIEPHCVIGDYINIFAYVGLGHHTTVMRNSVIQRHCSIAGNCVFESNTYIGIAVKALKTGARFGANTFIHECVYIRRGTIPNEIVSLHGENMSRVHQADASAQD